ncbi:MAG TPA: ferritin [Stellaceae bacterium]|nr:ferritin [Stellaceae bacterium]
MSSENLHAPRDRLSKKALTLHHAIVSLMEELDAIDWYRQRSDDAEDEQLKGLLLHNMREEMEHASMLLEYIRRTDSDFDRLLRTYLFTTKPILEIEDEATAEGVEGGAAKDKHRDRSAGASEGAFTVGPLRGN